MELLPISEIKINQSKIDKIDHLVKSIYRLIIYSRHHLDDDLLDIYLASVQELQELLSIKNAEMEAQNKEEEEEYLKNLKISLEFVIEEIIDHTNFEKELQLFQLLRLISPNTISTNSKQYRQTFLQIGNHIYPDKNEVSKLISELFHQMKGISNPIIRAIYFHHELIRINPFADGNGRVARIAKNWMLMFDLYPPIFINDTAQKNKYIETLSKSFNELEHSPQKWNEHTENFFKQELDRLFINATLLYDIVNKIGEERKKTKSKTLI
jgi:Fic family protein